LAGAIQKQGLYRIRRSESIADQYFVANR